MPVCYIAFGSNVGNRLDYITQAIDLLKRLGKIRKISTVYTSKPWGRTDQPEFLNGVLEFETELDPIGLLNILKEIEQACGRKPRERWGAREVDLDILLYENHILMLSFLRVPHLHLLERDFFLFPLLELNPELEHPLFGKKLKEYSHSLENHLKPFACLLPF